MFIETIKVKQHEFHNLSFHQKRLSNTQKEKLNIEPSIILAESLQIPDGLSEEVYKCRVIYDKKIRKVEFLSYKLPKINSLQIVRTKNLNYQYKYSDRQALHKLYGEKGDKDDIIIVQNEVVQDSYYGNLLFFDKEKYYTPQKPLLKGTQRAKLLQDRRILEEEIKTSDIKYFIFVKIINAMLDLEDAPKVDIQEVYF